MTTFYTPAKTGVFERTHSVLQASHVSLKPKREQPEGKDTGLLPPASRSTSKPTHRLCCGCPAAAFQRLIKAKEFARAFAMGHIGPLLATLKEHSYTHIFMCMTRQEFYGLFS